MSLNTKKAEFLITSEEVENTLSEGQNGRSDHPYLVDLELLKYASKNIIRILTQLYISIFSGDPILQELKRLFNTNFKERGQTCFQKLQRNMCYKFSNKNIPKHFLTRKRI